MPGATQGAKYSLGELKLPRAAWVSLGPNPFFLMADTDLPSLGPSGLCSAYQKFKAITNTTPKVMGLSKDAEWKAQFSDMHPNGRCEYLGQYSVLFQDKESVTRQKFLVSLEQTYALYGIPVKTHALRGTLFHRKAGGDAR